ncbi:MAG: DUF2807 domain-containing protein [Dehalococcoidia bacterium]|nr:DUF2807 domain-containing protein [Dehalococcoidia bacterium]
MRRTATVLALAVSFLVAGCSGIVGERGSGDLVSEMREVTPFTGIDVSRAIEVEVTVAAGVASSVEVVYDDNLIDGIEVSVIDGVLFIDADRNMRPSSGAKVRVRVESLHRITASGASEVTVTGAVAAEHMELRASGASRIEIATLEAGSLVATVSGASNVTVDAGDVGEADLDISGASHVDLGANVATALVDVSGASRARLTRADEVTGEASGASKVIVASQATRVRVDTSGASSVDEE